MADGPERSEHRAGKGDIGIGAADEDRRLAGSDERGRSHDGGVDQFPARRTDVRRKGRLEVRPGRAHLHEELAVAGGQRTVLARGR